MKSDIDPNANELEDLHRDDTEKNKEDVDMENKQGGKDQITPWDVIDKNATE